VTNAAPIVFIASTCYDLTDIRAELRRHLEKDGFIVRLSDAWDSDFRVNPEVNSIDSCLESLRGSDVAVFILDRRYGPPLGGKYDDKSATYVEFKTAIENKMRAFFFIRKMTMGEFDLWRGHKEAFEAKWVDRRQVEELFNFIAEIRDLHNAEGRSNWIDPFEASPDLRDVVSKRLYDLFPAQAVARAMARDRVVRLRFNTAVRESGIGPHKLISKSVYLKNIGLSVAVDIYSFLEQEGKPPSKGVRHPALGVQEETSGMHFAVGERAGVTVVCEYANLWGDRYRISAPIREERLRYSLGKEEFRVLQIG